MEESQVTDKPRVRVKAGSNVPSGSGIGAPVRAQGSYLRDTKSGVISGRPASLQEHREEIRRVWRRAGALAMDMLQNSGRLRGAADQIIADSHGVDLPINYAPRLADFGYSEEEASAWIKARKAEFRGWCWDARECHARGQWTIPQQADIAIRNYLAFGESAGTIDYMSSAMRRRYGVKTGTKYSVFTPSKIVQDTSEMERMFQGVIRDENGRIAGYRCEVRENNFNTKRDFPARDNQGRQVFVHVFDPFSAEDERGISPLAATFRKYLMGENVDDATAQMHFLQVIYALTLTSEKPSAEAFEALEVLKGVDGGEDLANEFVNYFSAQLDRAAENEIRVGIDPQISHLAPGEKLTFESAKVPGAEQAPFRAEINRETARALGMSYGGYTLNYDTATYASTNMENASLYPVAVRRSDRIVAPNYLVPFQSWLDEGIGEGRIPFKPGYVVFAENREALSWATCIAPSKPTGDDEKRDRAVTERILNGTSTLADECSALGRDPDEVFTQRLAEHKRYTEAGMPSPFERKKGSEAANGKDNKEAA